VRFDENTLVVRSFRTNDVEAIAIGPEIGGHGGGDNRVVRDWLDAIRLRAPEKIRTSAQESLRTHTIVFAAERSPPRAAHGGNLRDVIKRVVDATAVFVEYQKI
jgi:hypothetical protein